ncbi:MAG: hexitol phosphatase HxpB [Flavobacteriales bacterium]|nr:hexitol phosphatase HxpB [Flavobacteriales bacterium]
MCTNIKAVIFDMDGLIIDSEPLWRKSEMEVFQSMGYDFTEEICIQTMGMRLDTVVKFWYEKLKWSHPSIEDVVQNIQNKLIENVSEFGNPIEGVIETIHLLKESNIPIAIASSSSFKIINAVVEKLQLNKVFDVIHSAENEENGKPHPAVFNSTAKMLGFNNENCLVLEDSKFGMLAAINAGMKVIVVPENGKKPEWSKEADRTLSSLKDFNLKQLSFS